MTHTSRRAVTSITTDSKMVFSILARSRTVALSHASARLSSIAPASSTCGASGSRRASSSTCNSARRRSYFPRLRSPRSRIAFSPDRWYTGSTAKKEQTPARCTSRGNDLGGDAGHRTRAPKRQPTRRPCTARRAFCWHCAQEGQEDIRMVAR